MRDLVVVRVSKTKAASDSFVDKGVDEKDKMEESRWDLIVVFPEPDSPLVALDVSYVSMEYKPRSLRDGLQENNRLVLRSPSQPRPSSSSQVFGLAHRTTRFTAIRTLG